MDFLYEIPRLQLTIQILPKTMTHGYESWWNVGQAELANKETIVKVHEEVLENRAKVWVMIQI
ncbi:hypothetical protein C2W64_02447 [Brevibacillus laterosporus]|nr:hypothetical protein [Brevibacillus laterosporus]RAP24880.1 hypothetical protein C2W64_02447 [Brevibacillus laterosporus]